MAICKPGCSCEAERIHCKTPLTLMELELVLSAYATVGCLVLRDADDREVAAGLAARERLVIVGEQIPTKLRTGTATDGLPVLITDDGEKFALAHSLLLTRVIERSRNAELRTLLSTLTALAAPAKAAS